jgi:Rrf2 family transcriptional regulator, nitric oxide-sensitive transcriptional repressor
VHLTLHADYGLRVLIYLATHPERRVSTTEIGQAYGISRHHLVRVAQSLRDAGLVDLSVGRRGGISLARLASEIRIGSVIRALEPDLRLVECFDRETNTCTIARSCGLIGPLRRAAEAFLSSLDESTLADVVERSGPKLHQRFLPIDALARPR